MNPDPWQIDEKEFFRLATLAEKMKFLLRYAVLAPSTHNSQPWLFSVCDRSVKVSYDKKLRLPQADPKSRDLYISLGCLLENLFIAAQYFNAYDRIVYYPDTGNLVAEVFFTPGNGSVNGDFARIFHTIAHRVNARGVFKPETIDRSVLDSALPKDIHSDLSVDIITDREKIRQLAGLTAKGIRIAYKSPAFRREMSAWMHSSFSSKREGLLGYALKMPALASLVIPRLVRYLDMSPLLAGLNRKSLSSAPAVCVISALNNYPATWLQVGRLAENLMLEFNAHGARTSVFVASIEMGELSREVQKIIGTSYLPQFLFCAGYMSGHQRHSPRHPVESKII